MTIYFPDASRYQGNLKIQPGTCALSAKATEGTNYFDANYAEFKAQAASVGAEFCAYHFLWSGSAVEAKWAFDHVGKGVPLSIDAENTKVATGVATILSFVTEYRKLGGTVHTVYLPHWYWQDTLKSPDLTPLVKAGLVLEASAYTKYADDGPGWIAYGGVTPALWQYTDKFPYGGQAVDFNAFKGTVQQLHNLWHTGTIDGPQINPKPPKVPIPIPTKPKHPNILQAIHFLTIASKNRPGPVGDRVRQALKILKEIK